MNCLGSFYMREGIICQNRTLSCVMPLLATKSGELLLLPHELEDARFGENETNHRTILVKYC